MKLALYFGVYVFVHHWNYCFILGCVYGVNLSISYGHIIKCIIAIGMHIKLVYCSASYQAL